MSQGAARLARPAKAETTADDDRLDLRVWIGLFASVQLISARVQRNLRAEFDASLPRFDLLSQLHRSADGLTMGDLSRLLMVTNGNVTGLVERLEAEGLVYREPDRDDRRVQRVRFSETGRKLFDAMVPAHKEWINAALSGMSREELTALQGLLAKLKETLKTEDDSPSR